jgi:hypothetical protein
MNRAINSSQPPTTSPSACGRSAVRRFARLVMSPGYSASLTMMPTMSRPTTCWRNCGTTICRSPRVCGPRTICATNTAMWRPCPGAGAFRRNAAPDAGHRFHPDYLARPAFSRRLALYRDPLFRGTGAGGYPSGHRRRLCRARRSTCDASAGRDLGEGGRHSRAANSAPAKAISPRSRGGSTRPTVW